MTETLDGGSDFDEAFRVLLPRAVRVAYRILGDVNDAEDVAVEALARAAVSWRRVGRLPYRDAWVLRVAANAAVDVVRRRHRAPAGVEGAQPTHEDLVILQMALATALTRLSRRQREAVTLRYLVGMSEGDVARCLHISIGSVKRHTFRALSGLRDELGSDWEVAHNAR